jgi:hypothetical protein
MSNGLCSNIGWVALTRAFLSVTLICVTRARGGDWARIERELSSDKSYSAIKVAIRRGE